MFESLIGNQHVKLLMSKLLTKARFPNALLLAGPDGVGKKAFALETAKALVCPNRGCSACTACSRVARLNIPVSDKRDDFKTVFFTDHPDVGIVVPYNRNVLVDAIRVLEAEARFRPYEAAARVFIIDDADKMNDAASNALLKTLEEPALTTFIMLVSSRPDSLLPTVRSRCQTIRFGPVAAGDIQEYLQASGKFDGPEAAVVARLSGGSVARALTLNIAKIRSARDMMLGVIENALNGRTAAVLKTSERLNDAKNKDDFEENFDTLESLIRDIWLLSLSVDAESLANADLLSRLRPISDTTSSATIAGWLAEIALLRDRFAVNINRKIAADALFIKMAAG